MRSVQTVTVEPVNSLHLPGIGRYPYDREANEQAVRLMSGYRRESS